MMKFFRWLTPALGAIVLAGCVAPGRVSDTQDAELLARLGAGQATLECGLACVPVYSFNQQRIQQLQRARDWDGLAVAVMRADWRQDIGYFLLGMAAEGRRQFAAADRYYRMAGALATGADNTDKCASVRATCLGFNLPADIMPRLRAIAPFVPATAAAPAPVGASPSGAAPAAAAQVTAAPANPGADLIADAPQALLGQYAMRRLMAANPATAARDALFREQLLQVFEPAQAKQVAGNEIARDRAISTLLDRLGNQVADTRLSLGMYVQLRSYDLRSKSFEIAYPAHARPRVPEVGGAVYWGNANRNMPWNGYANSGSPCVWEPRGEYAGVAGQDVYFLMLTLCHPHPPTRQPMATLDDARAEVPPVFQLDVPRDSLWNRLPLEQSQAESLIGRLGPTRLAWAELVFDVRAITQNHPGPFNARQLRELKLPAALTAAIQPRALVLWEANPRGTGPGPLIGMLGEVQPVPIPASGRLPRALVADRAYPPPVAQPTIAPTAAPTAVAPAGTTTRPQSPPAAVAPVSRPRPAAPAPSPATPPPAKSASKPSADDEAWVEPPAAKR